MIQLGRPLIIQAERLSPHRHYSPAKATPSRFSLTPFLTQHKAGRVRFRFHFARGRFMRVALASVPAGAMDRHPAGGRIARPVDAPIAIAWRCGGVIIAISRVAAVGSSRSVSCVAMCPSVDACNAHGC